MITFSRLGAKVWRLVDCFDHVLIREMQRSDFETLDQEILNWYDSVPEEIKIDGLKTQIPIPGTSTYDVDRLQIWTRLRLNQVGFALGRKLSQANLSHRFASGCTLLYFTRRAALKETMISPNALWILRKRRYSILAFSTRTRMYIAASKSSTITS